MINNRGVSAGLGRQLLAIIYDTLLVISLLFVAGLITIPLLDMKQPNSWFFILVMMPIIILYFVLYWHKQSQTIGMKAWRIYLLNTNNNDIKPTIYQCLCRFFGAWLSFISLGFGFFYKWIDKDNQTWHDKLSNTKLIEV